MAKVRPGRLAGLCLLIILLCACAPAATSTATRAVATPLARLPATATATRTPIPEPGATRATPLPTPTDKITASPIPSQTATVTITATRTPVPTPQPCRARLPDDNLLTLVTRNFGLSRDYEPSDLVPLSDYFGPDVTLGYPTEVRAVLIQPLEAIIAAMKADGLRPQIVSGYRSYSEQSLAFQKWLTEFPDWGSNLSAPPGHSEHQLGTTVDFGSPELKWMLGENYVQFHPAFADTSEGQWLAAHAADYGFTMSYPEDAQERTAFLFEPWHFRYVGVDLAQSLASEELTISEYLEEENPVPCIPDE